MDLYRAFAPLLIGMPPELAHRMGIYALKWGWIDPLDAQVMRHPLLKTQCSGLVFNNPIGIAPGFDKNAEVAVALLALGFGFVECGTITPRAQQGNEKPRLFRLMEDRAVINRMGFNNAGLQQALKNLKKQEYGLAQARSTNGILGLNIGKNKDTAEAVEDYTRMLNGVYANASYITINISSPNTPGLRDLQARDALKNLLVPLVEQRAKLTAQSSRKVPLWLKVAPDLDEEGRKDVVAVARELSLDALVVGNTTLSRPATLKSPYRTEQGGLSGAPLMALSTEILADFYRLSEGKIPLIGVGGIASADDAYRKIRAGASLIQLYSALVYQGFGLVENIAKGLVQRLDADGFTSIRHAVGADHR